jgi:hypothetical protein
VGGERLEPPVADLSRVADNARGPTSMASGPNGEAGRVAGCTMRARRWLTGSLRSWPGCSA